MSRYVVFSSLWGRNFAVLESFVQRHCGSLVISERHPGPVGTARITQAGGSLMALADFIDPAAAQAVQDTVARRTEALGDFLASDGWRDECQRRGWPTEMLVGAVKGQVDQQFGPSALLTASLEQAHRQHPIDLVLVAEDVTPVGRAIVGWARQRGVATLQLAHGLALTQPYTISECLDTDLMAVFGERGKEGFVDIGISPDRLIATGNPSWDDYAEMVPRRSALRAQIAQLHGIDADVPWLVFGTTWCAYVSARNDGTINASCLQQFIITCRKLQLLGRVVQPIVKTRPNNSDALLAEIRVLCERYHYPHERVLIASDDPKAWVVCADLFVAMDSNLGVEAMLCGVPSINLANRQGMMLGPCLDAYSGIADVPPEDLFATAYQLLGDSRARADLLATARRAAPRYNIGIDGRATERLIDLMGRMAGARRARALVESQLGLLKRRPGRALALGRAEGIAATCLKRYFPACQVWGVEPDDVGAALSRPQLDHLLVGRLQELDLAAAGWAHGQFDTVLLDDELHRADDPAALLRLLRPYLAADAQILLCITNARNLRLAQEWVAGRWHGERAGLADQDYARLFSYQDIQRLLHQQHCEVGQVGCVADPALAEFSQAQQPNLPGDITLDRMVIKDVSAADLMELTAQYFLMRCTPLAA